MSNIFSKQFIYLLLIFVIGAVVIINNAFFAADGFLSPDSTQYLALAQNLLEGNGFTISSVSLNGNNRDFFAIWPLAYPFFIFIVAKISGLSVFFASKVVNIIFFALSLWMISKIFKKDSAVFASVLLFGVFLQLFSYSWSEIPFIFGLLWFCFSIEQYLSQTDKTVALIQLFLAGLFLFLTRYIGAFSFVVLGFIALWQLKQRRFSQFMALSTVILLGLICIGLYLYHNSIQTGWMTGKQRIPAFESNLQFLVMLVKAFAQELLVLTGRDKANFFWLMALQITVMVILWRGFKTDMSPSPPVNSVSRLTTIFFTVAIAYYIAIISSRFITHFDTLNYRLLAPGTLLLIFGLLLTAQHRYSGRFDRRIKGIVLALASISVIVTVVKTAPYVIPAVGSEPLNNYQQTIDRINADYRPIPDDALVVFADNHIRYLRTSLIVARPNYQPFATANESVTSFIRRITSAYPNKNIFIETSQQKVSCKRLDPSWCDYLKLHAQQQFYQIQ